MNLPHFKIISIVACLSLFTGCSHLKISNQKNEKALKETQITEATVPTEIAKPTEQEVTQFATQNINATPDIPNDKSDQHLTVWDAMREGFSLQSIKDPKAQKRIQKEIDWYLSHPNYIKTVNKRSEPYIFYILNEVKKQNLPHELALLPFVESGFDPKAYSYASAAGLWQFMPKTASSLGLKRDWWKDDRQDTVLSTQAALRYLSLMNTRFKGDWLLALAAYNSGAGNVSKAIRKNKKKGKPTTYWHLDLPKETQHYVPRLLAIAHIYQQPDKYDITLRPIKNEPYFTNIDTGTQIDLKVAAQLADLSVEKLIMLNPSFYKFATHPQGPHQLLIPTNKSDIFKKRLSELPKDKRVNWVRYTIKNGDSLSTIAYKHKLKIDILKKVNKLRSNTIRAGKTLLIPTGAVNYANIPNTSISNTTTKVKKRYTVRSGDSLWKIARAHNIRIKSIQKWNNLSAKKHIKPGQKLTLWIEKA